MDVAAGQIINAIRIIVETVIARIEQRRPEVRIGIRRPIARIGIHRADIDLLPAAIMDVIVHQTGSVTVITVKTTVAVTAVPRILLHTPTSTQHLPTMSTQQLAAMSTEQLATTTTTQQLAADIMVVIAIPTQIVTVITVNTTGVAVTKQQAG